MNSRREALLGRYRARSIERIAGLEASMEEVRAGRSSEELIREIARGLHTLKGDSTVVGMEALAHVAHATEELFLSSRQEGSQAVEVSPLLGEAFAAMKAVLRDELDAAQSEPALAAIRTDLAAALEHAPDQELSPKPDAVAGAEPLAAPVAGPASSSAAAPEPVAAAAPGPTRARAPGAASRRWVQVQSERVDAVCESVAGFLGQFEALAARLAPLLDALPNERRAETREALEALERCRVALEGAVVNAWSLRMVDVEPALEELVDHARQLASSLGKQVEVEIRGRGAQVERGVLEELLEPLLHLVRNALDHGIEPPEERGEKPRVARLLIEARGVGPLLEVVIADDGRGIDPEKVRAAAVRRGVCDARTAGRMTQAELHGLLFAHGFSTRSEANELSGRGVGLDVVRSRLSALGGSVTLHSEVGKGTRFSLTVPSSITREKVLLFESGGVLWGLPGENVMEVLRAGDSPVESSSAGRTLRHRGERVPLRGFGELLGAEPEEERWAVVVRWAERSLALGISNLLGEHELLRRGADPLVGALGPIAASAASRDGRMVLVARLETLFERMGRAQAKPRTAEPQPTRRRRVLVVDDSVTVRDLVCELLTEAGLEVEAAVDGAAALAQLQRTLPDLVLSDLEMPRMDGFELLREVRARHPRLPFVMLTTRASTEERRRAATLGASAYLVKSEFDEPALLETLSTLLGGLR